MRAVTRTERLLLELTRWNAGSVSSAQPELCWKEGEPTVEVVYTGKDRFTGDIVIPEL
jgi:hypothetical protein